MHIDNHRLNVYLPCDGYKNWHCRNMLAHTCTRPCGLEKQSRYHHHHPPSHCFMETRPVIEKLLCIEVQTMPLSPAPWIRGTTVKYHVPIHRSSAQTDSMVIYNLYGLDAIAMLIRQFCLARLRALVLTGWQHCMIKLWWFFSATLFVIAAVFIYSWMVWRFYGMCVCAQAFQCVCRMVKCCHTKKKKSVL